MSNDVETVVFEHVDKTGRFQFWHDDEEHVVDKSGFETDDRRVIALLDECPFVRRKAAKAGS